MAITKVASTETLSVAGGQGLTGVINDIITAIEGSGGGHTHELSVGATDVTATATELNTLDGITASTAELNILDGVTADKDEINTLDGITASTAELNILDGVTATASEINMLGGMSKSGNDLSLITGTAGTTNYVSKWNADGDLVDGFEVLDEDDMASDSDTKLATQQSIKKYVDDSIVSGKAMFSSRGSGSYGSGATNYVFPCFIGDPNATETNRQQIVPACTLKELRFYISTNTLNNNLVITVRDDAADTSLTKTVSSTTTGNQVITTDVSVDANSKISIEIDTSAAGSGTATIKSMALVYVLS